MLVGEGLRFVAGEHDRSDELVLDHDRDADQRAVVLGGTAVRVLGVGSDVGNVDGSTLDGRTAGGRRAVHGVRMFRVVLAAAEPRVVRHDVQKSVVKEVERAVFGLAEPLAGADHLVENRLQSRGARDGAQDGR